MFSKNKNHIDTRVKREDKKPGKDENRGPVDIQELLKAKINEYSERGKKPQYINHEFQDYGYRLALRLGEEKKKSMYIKLAKIVPRALIEDSAAFATDYPHAKNKGKLFLWKLGTLMDDYRIKHPDFVLPSLRNIVSGRGGSKSKTKAQTKESSKKPVKKSNQINLIEL